MFFTAGLQIGKSSNTAHDIDKWQFPINSVTTKQDILERKRAIYYNQTAKVLKYSLTDCNPLKL